MTHSGAVVVVFMGVYYASNRRFHFIQEAGCRASYGKPETGGKGQIGSRKLAEKRERQRLSACCAGCDITLHVRYDTHEYTKRAQASHSNRSSYESGIPTVNGLLIQPSKDVAHLKDLTTFSMASTRISACPSLNVSMGLNRTALVPEPPIFTPSTLARLRNSSR